MSMTFHRKVADHSICPGCAAKRTVGGLEENETANCLGCGMAYSHHVIDHDQIDTPVSTPSIIDVSEPDRKIQAPRPRELQQRSSFLKRKRKREHEHEADEGMRLFRRVRIIDEVKNSSKNDGKNMLAGLVIGREAVHCDHYHRHQYHHHHNQNPIPPPRLPIPTTANRTNAHAAKSRLSTPHAYVILSHRIPLFLHTLIHVHTSPFLLPVLLPYPQPNLNPPME